MKTVKQLEQELAIAQQQLNEANAKLVDLQEKGFQLKPVSFKAVKGVSDKGAFQGIQINGPFRGAYLSLNPAKAIVMHLNEFKAALASTPETVQTGTRRRR